MAVFRISVWFMVLPLLVALDPVSAVGQAEKPATTLPQTVASPTVQAQELLAAGKVDAALQLLKPLAASGSVDPQVTYLLGLATYQKGDYAQAIDFFSSAAGLTPETSQQHRQSVQLLGLSHYFLGHVKESIPFLERVAVWSPGNVEVAYVLGTGYVQTHNPDKARGAFARMFGVLSASASAYLINGQMMIRLGFEEYAEAELQKAIALDPKIPQAHFMLGEIAIYKADIDRGIELLKAEISVNPAFGMAYYRLGEALTRQLKWDEAIAPLQKSIWLTPYFSGSYIVLGKVYMKKADLQNAESILKRAVKMDPNNFSAHHLLAQALQQAGRAEEARKEFELAERLRAGADRTQ
jgi:tetratricopeptide (TPR) repeat protein